MPRKPGEPTVGLTIRLPQDMWDQYRAIAQQEGRPLNAVLREALERYLRDRGG